jgi:hypothetical protein
MKAIPFTIPMLQNASILVQQDVLPNFYKHLHRHPEIQIMLIVKGKGTILVSSNMFNFKENDIIIFGSNQEHLLKANIVKEENSNVELVHIYFNPLTKSIKELLEMPELSNIKQFVNKTNTGLLYSNAAFEPISTIMKLISKSSAALKISNFIALLDCLSKTKETTKLSNIL